MDWLLRTTDYRADGIFSELYDGLDLFCKTIEHAYEQPEGSWMPKLPRGVTYTCKRGFHRLEKYNKGDRFETFEITGVPGHTGILFHPGNFNRDSNGCVLPGTTLRTDANGWMVQHSQDAFAKLKSALVGVDEFQLAVE